MSSKPNVAEAYRKGGTFKLLEEPVDRARPLRVVIVGAGFSGIATAYKIAQSLKNIDFVIYEKNEDFGGTWLENRYPGVSCDVPSHSYQFTFALNTEWSSYYPPGAETLAYIQKVAGRFGLRRHTKFQHSLVNALWSEEQGKWSLVVERADGSRFEDSAHIVVAATGILNMWSMPDIPGIEAFKGALVHTAGWSLGLVDDSWKNRRVAVIGCTATQLVPAIQPYVKQLDNYVRGRTWVSNVFSEEEKRVFRENPQVYDALRIETEDFMNAAHQMTLEGSKMQSSVRKAFEKRMRAMLKDSPQIADALIPDFPVVCRRLTGGMGYLEALVIHLTDEFTKAQYINCEIARITESGIETTDGKRRSYDVIIAATGYDTTFVPRYPIIGRCGTNIQDTWKEYPRTYLGLCQDTHPNWFQLTGPNTGLALGSLVPIIEAQADYVVACIDKFQRERIKTMTVRKAAVDDFQAYVDAYFPRTVFARRCRTWYKRGDPDGKVVALWPGSNLNQILVLEHPRFEDYDYTYTGDNSSQNRFYWLGNGSTLSQDEDKPGTRAWNITRKPSAKL
ncbi:hypothetical protein PHLGIDRAFT_70919 [Phlebiopsis gigantea 11061_1 CR5-6]|uniref:FAD/NAD(P)-binding domain-containing protein n=1 Tax=Phlebiopsis gigantea (strain 11061_1 CR5-6) TaxID=745531 RepID=A0A0C3NQV3_PHLG1|nr:hypothetical protein PHLGIDRAFT_70919 [Phlebiopsis gigantea 11061_1 CR5-6]